MSISNQSRKMHEEFCVGWNTWDVSSVTSHVYLPEGIRVNLSFCIPHMSAYLEHVMWENVHSFGEHALKGEFTEVEIQYLNGLYRIETAASNEEFVARITPVTKRYNCFMLAEVTGIWGSKVSTSYTEDGVLASCNEKTFKVTSHSAQRELDWNPSCSTHICVSLDDVVYIMVNSERSPSDIDHMLKASKEKWLCSTINAQDELGSGIEAMRRSLLWNIMFEPRSRRAITPVSKNWSNPEMFNHFGNDEQEDSAGMLDEKASKGIPQINIHGNYVLFDWDTFFAALMYGLFDKNLAYLTAFSALEEMCDDDYIPNASTGNGKVRDRTQPQVGAFCVWKLYTQFKDQWFIEECFERLYRWNNWRIKHRDFRGDGLLELGAIVPGGWRDDEEIWPYINLGLRWALGCESGLDNSTMWDSAELDHEKGFMKLYYVGLNAEMVLDCECLEKMAILLKDSDRAREMKERRDNLIKNIQSVLWSGEKGCFLNKHWNGNFESTLSPTHFYTLTAGIATNEQADKMVFEHILNEDEFWGRYKLPSTPANDSRYQEQDYWRGRIWAPLNFIVGEGLLRYGYHDAYSELAVNGLEMFVDGWKKQGVVGENYNAVTGMAAESIEGSDKFYHWGALMTYVYIQGIIHFDAFNDEIKQGKAKYTANINNIILSDGVYDIINSELKRK